MSATNSTAITGRSTHVSPLAAAVALAAIVAFGAVGLAISQGVGTSSTAAEAKAGPAIVTESTMSGPRTGAQRGLSGVNTPYSGTDFAGQYSQWLAAQQALQASPDYWQRLDRPVTVQVTNGISNHGRMPQ